ncbi:sugar kinase [Psychrosphaera sp. F3M07]|uniref:sugar kinase n=1 Tax=Psychrosphaera sp. F3M07 TaxID=2841560 RepID=UPI001C09D668|nr:sugar kinase [Psychrosphaera sp. F3M07]MBU2918823.1 sugar kinase [Psychrosphaera sp. F3M07]
MFESCSQSPVFVAIGECMMELSPDTQHTLKKSYAGDTYNALVYAKRVFPTMFTNWFSAIGNDEMSMSMKARWAEEGIDDTFVMKSTDHSIGIYAISVDDSGERSFSYWRKNSAATTMMQFSTVEEYVALLNNVDLVFFSGISLGILTNNDRAKLIKVLGRLKSLGKQIAFDPNYRAQMFDGEQDAKIWFEQAYRVSTIALPGLDEHQQVYNHHSVEDVVNYCYSLGVDEVIVKAGNKGSYGYQNNQLKVHIPFVPAPQQIDTTAAGDSFAGVYLASRINQLSINHSLLNATMVASEVVQHQGAILPQGVFDQTLINKLNLQSRS